MTDVVPFAQSGQAIDLKIEFVVRDRTGAVASVVTSDGVVDAGFASEQIRTGQARYFAGPDSYVRARVKSIPALGGAFLYANWDGTKRNNIHDLARGLARVEGPQVGRPARARRRDRDRARWVTRILVRAKALLAH